MKKQEVLTEFCIEELEARLEMKAWIEVEPCDDPTHCHNEQQ